MRTVGDMKISEIEKGRCGKNGSISYIQDVILFRSTARFRSHTRY